MAELLKLRGGIRRHRDAVLAFEHFLGRSDLHLCRPPFEQRVSPEYSDSLSLRSRNNLARTSRAICPFCTAESNPA